MNPDPADSLHEAPPAEFVKSRNALVKTLRAGGQRAEAQRIAKLPRPTASVWATNQVARRASGLVAGLAAATARLQGGVHRHRESYAAAINQHRELMSQLRDQVEKALAGAGLRASPAVIAAAERRAADAVAAGEAELESLPAALAGR